MLAAMSLAERIIFAIVGLLVVAALVLAVDLDIGRNGKIPPGGLVEQPRR
jgi:hypothetical protein